MPLPQSRDIDFEPLMPVPSTVLNNIQDGLVGHERSREHFLSILTGAFGRGLYRSAADVSPFGRAGAVTNHTSSDPPVVHFAGGLWLGRATLGTLPFLPYVSNDAQLDTVLDPVPGAGAWRRDIVCVRLLNAGGSIALERQYLAGNVVVGLPQTAVDPPTPPGFTKIASILVGNGTNIIAHSAIRDYRVPLGRATLDVPARLGSIQSGWTVLGSDGVQSAAPGNVLRLFPHPGAAYDWRLTKLQMVHSLGGAGSVWLIRRHFADAGPMFEVPLRNLSASFAAPGLGTWTPGADDNFWGNGFEAGVPTYEQPASAGPEAGTRSMLGLRVIAGAAAEIVRFVRWEFAGL